MVRKYVKRKKAFKKRPLKALMRSRYGKFKYTIHDYKRTLQANGFNITNVNCSSGSSFTINTDYLKMVPYNVVGQNFYSLGLAFCIGDLPNYTEFSNLYDCYRIRGVKLRLIPICTQGSMFSNGLLEGILLHYVTDLDDGASPSASATGITDLQQYSNYKCVINAVGRRSINIYLKPRYAQAVYNTAVSTGYTEGNRSLWLDMTNTQVPHYGVKLLFEHYHTSTDNATYLWKLEATYYFQCKDVR